MTLLVKAGLASVASGAATLLLSVSFAALSFLEPFDAAYEIYLITALQGFVLMITGIIARGKWQSLGVMAIALAALALDFFSRIVPAGLFSKNVDDYVICNLVIVISAFIGRAIMSRNTLLLRKAESEASESAERLSRLEAAVESSGVPSTSALPSGSRPRGPGSSSTNSVPPPWRRRIGWRLSPRAFAP